MNIYQYLHRDHEEVSDLFEQVLATNSVSKRTRLLEQIEARLLLHARTEEATFYKALKRFHNMKDRIGYAVREHHEIKGYMKKLSRLSADSSKWMELFGEFKHSVTHHIAEEEDEVFSKARQLLDAEEARTLAVEMDAMKAEISRKAA